MLLSVIRIAIAGDLHGDWDVDDNQLVRELNPDCILFVGDLSDIGDIKLIKTLTKIDLPTAIILGNHDRGTDRSGEFLKLQLGLLGDLHCGWRFRDWNNPPIAVVGARPCSSGGKYFLAPAVHSLYGSISLKESADRITLAATQAPLDWPLIILAHSGPSGLGSLSNSPCGRDWAKPEVDWGDQDLEIAISNIRKFRNPKLVVFGHTHHQLKRNQGIRQTFIKDNFGTFYLNSACVPRHGVDEKGDFIFHLSWIEFEDGNLSSASHRWYRNDASLAYIEELI